MGKKLQLAGRKFSRLLVLGEVKVSHQDGLIVWKCLCDCGAIVNICGSFLVRGRTHSCGCLQKETASKNGKGCATHGMSKTRAFRTWGGMLARCLNKKSKHYKNYGARGISVCDRWLKFEDFFSDMGHPPAGMSIERENNSGNYEPNNCKWATPVEQANNRRSCVLVEFQGEKLTIAQWSKKTGINRQTLYSRVRQKWTPDAVFAGASNG